MSLFSLLICTICFVNGVGQPTKQVNDSINNLILPKGYKTSVVGAIPHFKKSGSGKQAFILIPGLGFDETIFDGFVKATENRYVLYSVTIAGFGKTAAPPVPAAETSFGEQTWSKSAIAGIKKLIEEEHIIRPVIVGHFTLGTQLALRFVLDYPDLVGGVLILGGPAKLIVTQNGQVMDYPLSGLISYTDKVTAPKFFKGIDETRFNAGNYVPEVYSIKAGVGSGLWKEVATNLLPVMVRYLCEFHASDLRPETERIKCPVLVLRPGFTAELLSRPENPNFNYIKPQFIDGWEPVAKNNPRIQIVDIPNAGTFLWKDQPDSTYRQIDLFVTTKVQEKK